MKKCSRCNIDQPLEQFSFKNKKTGSRSAYCIACNKKYQREHYQLNKQAYRDKARAYEDANGGTLGKRLRRYNLSEAQFNTLLGRYGGMCWICLKVEATVIDHDHACCSGEVSCGECVRGVLCRNCNSMIGYATDNIDHLNQAIEYLTP